MVVWARVKRLPWGTTCLEAALGGHLDVLCWAKAHGAPWDKGVQIRRVGTTVTP